MVRTLHKFSFKESIIYEQWIFKNLNGRWALKYGYMIIGLNFIILLDMILYIEIVIGLGLLFGPNHE